MTILIEAITYFLAGAFSVDTAIKIQSANSTSTLPIAPGLILAIGGILILAAFVYLLSVFPCKLVTFISRKLLRFKPWITAFLFIITLTQVATILLSNLGMLPLLIISSLFLIVLFAAIVYTSRQVFVNVGQLLTMIFTLGLEGIVILVTEDLSNSKVKLLFILILISVLALWTIGVSSWKRKRAKRGASPPS
jgi:hypothetical protein